MQYEMLTLEKLQKDLLSAFQFLYLRDSQLVECGANERCLSARYFSYIQNKVLKDPAYDGLTFDPEYNRKGIGGKPKNMGGDGKIIPDIILHKRGTDTANILVIEFKKSCRAARRDNDMRKLAYMTGTAYSYRYGLYVEMGKDELLLSWFQNGGPLPILVDRYSTCDWESLSMLAEHRQSARRRGCTLMVTRRCNMNCSYCYEPYKAKSKSFDMTLPVAKRILKREFEFVRNSKDFDEIEIDFMGGEPLMNFHLIKSVVEWLEQEPPPIPYICFATTNGTLVAQHEKWLRSHAATFQMGGSCDGNPEMQSTNRGIKSTMSQMELLQEIYPRQNFHMTISRATLPSLADGVLFLQQKGFRVECALAQGEMWTANDAALFHRELQRLAQEYLKPKCTLRPINLLARPLFGIADDVEKKEQTKFCGTGTHMVTYDYDGKCYGCHLFTPIVLGKSARTISEIDYTCAESIIDERCRLCVLKHICPTCAGFNYRYRGALGRRDMSVCKMIYEEALVASIFQAKQVARMKIPTTEDIVCARDALAANDVLKKIHADNGPYTKKG